MKKTPEKERRPVFDTMVRVLALVFFVCLLLYIGRINYPLFHALVEAMAATLYIGAFVVILNVSGFGMQGYFQILGAACFFGSILIMAQIPAFHGIGGIGAAEGGGPPGKAGALAAQLDLASRFLIGIAYMAAPFAAGRRLQTMGAVALFFPLFAILLFGILFHPLFPAPYDSAGEATAFKRVCEYAIALLLLVCLVLLYKKRRSFQEITVRLAAWSIAWALVAQWCFILQSGYREPLSLLGHLASVLSCYFAFKAVVHAGLACARSDFEKSCTSLSGEKEFAERLIDSAKIIVLLLDPLGRVVRINKEMERISGYRLEDLQDRNFFTLFFHEEYRTFYRAILLDTPMYLDLSGCVLPLSARDGSLHFIEWYNAPVKDDIGRLTGVLAVGEDITRKKQFEEELRESEHKYRRIADFASRGFCTLSGDFTVMEINHCFCKLLNADRKEVIGKSLLAYIDDSHDDNTHKAELKKRFSRISGTGGIVWETVLKRKDAEAAQVLLSATALQDGQEGSSCRYFVFVTDISAHKSLERSLLEQEERFHVFCEGTSDAIAIVDEGVVLAANRAFNAMVYSPSYGTQGMSIREILGLRNGNALEDFILAGSDGPFETELKGGDGSLLILDTRVQPATCLERPVNVIVARDITSHALKHRRMLALLREKEALLREVLYRAKSSLELIAGLIHPDKNPVLENETGKIIRQARAFIAALSLAYEKACTAKESAALATVAMNEYLENLVNKLQDSCGLSTQTALAQRLPAVECLSQPLALPLDRAAACGLIATLLLQANSSGQDGGRVEIALHSVSPGRCELVIHDERAGIYREEDLDNPQTGVLKAVTGIVKNHLGGEWTAIRTSGQGVRICIPFAADSPSRHPDKEQANQ